MLSDCLDAIGLQADNMKAYYYLSQAQMALQHPNEALNSALTAYDLCLKTGDASVNNISALVLRAKKEKWEVRERDRIRRRDALLDELEGKLQKARRDDRATIDMLLANGELDPATAQDEAHILDQVTTQKIQDLRSVFAVADSQLAYRVRLFIPLEPLLGDFAVL